jgi:hypothetical protein
MLTPAAPLPDDARFQRPGACSYSVLGDEVLVLDMSKRKSHRLLETAAFIWQRAIKRETAADIAASLASRYDVDAARARADVDGALRDFLAAGILAAE